MSFATLLDDEQARTLVARAQAAPPGERAGEAATTALLTAMGPMIDAYVAKFSWSGVDRDDLAQEGCIALWRAVVTYNPAKGAPFWAWAAWWVRGMCGRWAKRTRREPGRVGIDVAGGISSDELEALSATPDGADIAAEERERRRRAAEVVADLEGLFVADGPVGGDRARHERMRFGHPAVRGRIARRMGTGGVGR